MHEKILSAKWWPFCQDPSHWDMLVSDWDGHVGAPGGVFSDTHAERERILEFAIVNGLPVGYTSVEAERYAPDNKEIRHEEMQVVTPYPNLEAQTPNYRYPVPVSLQGKNEDCCGCSSYRCWCRCWYCKSHWVSVVKADGHFAGCCHRSLWSLQESPVETRGGMNRWTKLYELPGVFPRLCAW